MHKNKSNVYCGVTLPWRQETHRGGDNRKMFQGGTGRGKMCSLHPNILRYFVFDCANQRRRMCRDHPVCSHIARHLHDKVMNLHFEPPKVPHKIQRGVVGVTNMY